ncbi:MAG: ATP-binding protein [Rhodobacteraceae bacterium]|nr:ATP-binding protein [Paracoccaceae bacterium]
MQEIVKHTGFKLSKQLLRAGIIAFAVGVIAFFVPHPERLWAMPWWLAFAVFSVIFAILLVEHYFRKNETGQVPDPATKALDRRGETVYSDSLLETLPVALIRLSNSGVIEFANLTARQLLGREQISGHDFADLVEGLGRSMRERLEEVAKGNTGRTAEMGRCMVNGGEVFLQVSLMKISYVEGDCCMAILNDKTELKMLEAQFVQSQKMEAVGQLAGGVAHDFNNLLTAINGHSELLLLRHKSGDPDYGDLIQIRQNTIRAAALVRQLLAFSRKQTLRPKVVNLIDTLHELTKLLDRLLGEKVTLIIEESPHLAPVRVDVQQFEQVIMNLVVNARDAMPDGGNVIISTQNLVLEKQFKRDRATVPAGNYVLVKVRDRGCGIPADILPKIFEPFYTTKRVGEGTGLGLSTVYGIVKQTGGFVFVQSIVGDGSEFEIYLPSYKAATVEPKKKLPEKQDKSDAKGNILLVEDEDSVRAFAARALKLKGYSVVEANSGEQALKVLADSKARFDLFISDVVMPGLNGPGWVRQALKTHPDTKIIFVSGYSEDTFSDDRKDISEASFLPKPFSLVALTDKVAEVIAE